MSQPFFKRVTKTLLIICNVAVALAFVIGSYVKYFNPEKWWFIGLLTIALPYILLVLLLFLFGWIIAKKIWLLISLSAIAFCWQAVLNIFPVHFSEKFTTEKKVSDVRVMTWNVEQFNITAHKSRPETKQKMLQIIKQYQPDIACFQEMVGGDDDKAINYLGDFKRNLDFSGYYYSYVNKYNFDNVHHFGVIIFSKFPIINRQTVAISPNDYNSTFQYVDVIAGYDTLRIINIHLQSLSLSQNNLKYLDNPFTNTDTALSESRTIISKLKMGFLRRYRQSKKVKEEIDKSPYPVVVCGDFNDVPNSYAYTKIGDGMQNVFEVKGLGFGRTYWGISPTLRIDNIFVDDKFKIQQTTRIPKKLVDHFPIIADIHLEK